MAGPLTFCCLLDVISTRFRCSSPSSYHLLSDQVAALLCSSVVEAIFSWLERLVAQLLHIYPDLLNQVHLSVLLHRSVEAKGAGRGLVY